MQYVDAITICKAIHNNLPLVKNFSLFSSEIPYLTYFYSLYNTLSDNGIFSNA